jgi:hypothetical protein
MALRELKPTATRIECSLKKKLPEIAAHEFHFASKPKERFIVRRVSGQCAFPSSAATRPRALN